MGKGNTNTNKESEIKKNVKDNANNTKYLIILIFLDLISRSQVGSIKMSNLIIVIIKVVPIKEIKEVLNLNYKNNYN